MSESVSKSILLGNCYNKKFIVSEKDTKVILFTLTTYEWDNKIKQDRPIFHNMVAYNELANLLNDYIPEKIEGQKQETRSIFAECSITQYTKDGVSNIQNKLIKVSLLTPRKLNDQP